MQCLLRCIKVYFQQLKYMILYNEVLWWYKVFNTSFWSFTYTRSIKMQSIEAQNLYRIEATLKQAEQQQT